MELVQQSPLVPFETAPAGSVLACNIVIGVRPDKSFALEQRLPSGVPFDQNNPAHIFGMFVVQNAQQLMSLAYQAAQQANAVQQTNEIIAKASLQGA
jgi:hypothetical protein